jgi:hypothetical protein
MAKQWGYGGHHQNDSKKLIGNCCSIPFISATPSVQKSYVRKICHYTQFGICACTCVVMQQSISTKHE